MKTPIRLTLVAFALLFAAPDVLPTAPTPAVAAPTSSERSLIRRVPFRRGGVVVRRVPIRRRGPFGRIFRR